MARDSTAVVWRDGRSGLQAAAAAAAPPANAAATADDRTHARSGALATAAAARQAASQAARPAVAVASARAPRVGDRWVGIEARGAPRQHARHARHYERRGKWWSARVFLTFAALLSRRNRAADEPPGARVDDARTDEPPGACVDDVRAAFSVRCVDLGSCGAGGLDAGCAIAYIAPRPRRAAAFA